MIIKFKSNGTWVVFGEVDHVEYNKSDFDPQKDAVSSGVIIYDPADDQPVVNRISMGFFTKNMNEATQIIACSPIYLMNDQGRTVETI
jgi:hypothetical protein